MIKRLKDWGTGALRQPWFLVLVEFYLAIRAVVIALPAILPDPPWWLASAATVKGYAPFFSAAPWTQDVWAYGLVIGGTWTVISMIFDWPQAWRAATAVLAGSSFIYVLGLFYGGFATVATVSLWGGWTVVLMVRYWKLTKTMKLQRSLIEETR